MRRRVWRLLLGVVAAAVAGLLLQPPAASPGLTEAEARRRFYARYPGRQPLNQAVGEAAVRLHQSRPMGKFVLGLRTPGNDCSDFVACCIDEGLGVGARFKRGSDRHLLGENRLLFERFVWRPGRTVMPGDTVVVRHSPWYPPNDRSCWHCGLVGSDGRVYDFTKLMSWPEPRYGRHTFAEFIRHCGEPGEVVIERLRWQYRYQAVPLPTGRPGSGLDS